MLKSLLRRVKRKLDGTGSPWPAILGRSQALMAQRKSSGLRVLAATSVGSHHLVRLIDSLVDTALWLRGAEVTTLLCDQALPACEAAMLGVFKDPQEFVQHGSTRVQCQACVDGGTEFLAPLPFPLHGYRDYLAPHAPERALALTAAMSEEACYAYRADGLPLGEQARSGVLRFFGKATFEAEDPHYVERVARRYLAGAIVAAQAGRAAIEELRPDVMIAHHGVYVPQGVLGLVARQMGVRVVNWGPSYRNTTFIYSHHDSYHRTFITEPNTNWDRPLSQTESDDLLRYLQVRRGGKGDWSWVPPDRGEQGIIEDEARLIRELALDPAKPTFGLLTNVLWDAQLYYGGNAFTDMLEWLFATLDFFVAHPELQLIVRVHPHEVKAGNRQPTGPEIAHRYASLPPNIKIVDRDSRYSTYALMDLCRATLIYGTKTGVELAPFGMPVIVAGEAWLKNKGIAQEVTSRAHYQEILAALPGIEPLSPELRERAKRYAYHYFFRRMIPLGLLDPDAGYPPKLTISELGELMPGRDRGLDVICEGIATGSEFLYEGPR